MRMAWALVVLLSWLSAVPASAHHPFAAEYDGNKPVTVKGVVAKIAWVNPHAYIYTYGRAMKVARQPPMLSKPAARMRC